MSVAVKIEDVGLREAAGGDEGAFRALVEGERAELHAHCYRMLGSLHDADDALQETLLRAWRALPALPGTQLGADVAVPDRDQRLLDAIARRPKRVLPLDYGPPSGPRRATESRRTPRDGMDRALPRRALGVADGAAGPRSRYERREALELAFVAALQHLPPRQRAALILRDVLGFSAREAAETLETTEPSVNGALRRARATLAKRLPDPSQQVTLRALGDRRLQALVQRFADSFERGDVGAILDLLTEDARSRCRPIRSAAAAAMPSPTRG